MSLRKKLGGIFLVFFWSFLPYRSEAAPRSLAEWTFPHNPDDAFVDTATEENGTELVELSGASNLSFETSGATTNSARATGWQDGAETKYWFTKVNSSGYKDLFLSVKLRSSSTGPRHFSLQYRLQETDAWLDVIGGTITVADNFSTGSLELLPLPQEANNQESVFIRLLMTSNQSVGGGTVTSTGANRLDDLLITATPLEEEAPDPEPGSQCTGSGDELRISEILPYPAASNQEYAELFNAGTQCVDISGWRLEDAGGHKYIFPSSTTIAPEEYSVIIHNLFLNNTTGDTLKFFNQNNELVEEVLYEQAIKGLSYSLDTVLEDWRFTSFLTPGAENTFDETHENEEGTNEEPEEGIILSEIFPNPKSDESVREFIELQNISSENKDIGGWSLIDASQKTFILPKHTIIPENGFLTLYRTQFTFPLNNTGSETISLLDANGNVVDETEYTGTQEDFSYSFTGSNWRWTKKKTPQTKNEFSKLPNLTVTSKKEGFASLPLSFSVEVKNTKGSLRYSWDFGDGRHSTLAAPKHTYAKTGNYKASVTVRTKSNEITKKDFTVTIKKYPKYPVVITALQPNPKGKDGGQEWLEIKNLSQKNIRLAGWKVATGTDDAVNHAIASHVTLLPEQTLRLTQKDAAFTLPNTTGIVELRYPNDTVANRVTYDEEKISESSVCTPANGICNFVNASEKKAEQKNPAPEQEILQKETSGKEFKDIDIKKELLKRIEKDVNLLLNQIVADTISKGKR